jgi:hypothetical protein
MFHFSNELIQDIENNSSIQSYKTGDVIMRRSVYKQYYASHQRPA